MAKKGIKGLFVQVLAGANIVTSLLMILTGYSYLVNPSKFSLASTMGLFFPFFLALNILFLIFWLFFHWKKAYLPVLTLFVCYIPVRTYLGINTSEEVPEGAIKVMSYNVLGFHGLPDNVLGHEENALVDYLCEQDCDIVCAQESCEGNLRDKCKKKLYECYPYHREDAKKRNGTRLAIYSKHEILEFDTIQYDSRGNWTAAYILKIGKQEVFVINNYLEISSLTPEDREQFSNMIRGNLDSDSAKVQSKSMIGKLSESAAVRAKQADAVAKYIKQHRGRKIILMGDFNDNPISYTHHTISKDLTDCFVSTGKGPGWSYCHNAMRVRIDNIMCSKDIIPYGCKVDNKTSLSDHYPMVCWLKID